MPEAVAHRAPQNTLLYFSPENIQRNDRCFDGDNKLFLFEMIEVQSPQSRDQPTIITAIPKRGGSHVFALPTPLAYTV